MPIAEYSEIIVPKLESSSDLPVGKERVGGNCGVTRINPLSKDNWQYCTVAETCYDPADSWGLKKGLCCNGL